MKNAFLWTTGLLAASALTVIGAQVQSISAPVDSSIEQAQNGSTTIRHGNTTIISPSSRTNTVVGSDGSVTTTSEEASWSERWSAMSPSERQAYESRVENGWSRMNRNERAEAEESWERRKEQAQVDYKANRDAWSARRDNVRQDQLRSMLESDAAVDYRGAENN